MLFTKSLKQTARSRPKGKRAAPKQSKGYAYSFGLRLAAPREFLKIT